MKAMFAVTDPDWLATLAATRAIEVNFWQPRPTRVAQEAGTPWVFKIRGTNRIGGFGFFSYWTEMPLMTAWEFFGSANGVASLSEMRARVSALRHGPAGDERVGCVVLTDCVILAPEEHVAAPNDWKPNIVRGKGYDIDAGEGERVWSQLRGLDPRVAQPALSEIIETPGGYTAPKLVAARRGQGSFRSMVMDAYGRRCAVTGERTLPALEAAHIVPFREHARHEVRNGILMRSDIHRLYDAGLVTVKPDLAFRVSQRIERDYSNGKIYYALDGKTIATPVIASLQPDSEALYWHSEQIFRP